MFFYLGTPGQMFSDCSDLPFYVLQQRFDLAKTHKLNFKYVSRPGEIHHLLTTSTTRCLQERKKKTKEKKKGILKWGLSSNVHIYYPKHCPRLFYYRQWVFSCTYSLLLMAEFMNGMTFFFFSPQFNRERYWILTISLKNIFTVCWRDYSDNASFPSKHIQCHTL